MLIKNRSQNRRGLDGSEEQLQSCYPRISGRPKIVAEVDRDLWWRKTAQHCARSLKTSERMRTLGQLSVRQLQRLPAAMLRFTLRNLQAHIWPPTP
jgi:hypothetical protein